MVRFYDGPTHSPKAKQCHCLNCVRIREDEMRRVQHSYRFPKTNQVSPLDTFMQVENNRIITQIVPVRELPRAEVNAFPAAPPPPPIIVRPAPIPKPPQIAAHAPNPAAGNFWLKGFSFLPSSMQSFPLFTPLGLIVLGVIVVSAGLITGGVILGLSSSNGTTSSNKTITDNDKNFLNETSESKNFTTSLDEETNIASSESYSYSSVILTTINSAYTESDNTLLVSENTDSIISNLTESEFNSSIELIFQSTQPNDGSTTMIDNLMPNITDQTLSYHSLSGINSSITEISYVASYSDEISTAETSKDIQFNDITNYDSSKSDVPQSTMADISQALNGSTVNSELNQESQSYESINISYFSTLEANGGQVYSTNLYSKPIELSSFSIESNFSSTNDIYTTDISSNNTVTFGTHRSNNSEIYPDMQTTPKNLSFEMYYTLITNISTESQNQTPSKLYSISYQEQKSFSSNTELFDKENFLTESSTSLGNSSYITTLRIEINNTEYSLINSFTENSNISTIGFVTDTTKKYNAIDNLFITMESSNHSNIKNFTTSTPFESNNESTVTTNEVTIRENNASKPEDLSPSEFDSSSFASNANQAQITTPIDNAGYSSSNTNISGTLSNAVTNQGINSNGSLFDSSSFASNANQAQITTPIDNAGYSSSNTNISGTLSNAVTNQGINSNGSLFDSSSFASNANQAQITTPIDNAGYSSSNTNISGTLSNAVTNQGINSNGSLFDSSSFASNANQAQITTPIDNAGYSSSNTNISGTLSNAVTNQGINSNGSLFDSSSFASNANQAQITTPIDIAVSSQINFTVANSSFNENFVTTTTKLTSEITPPDPYYFSPNTSFTIVSYFTSDPTLNETYHSNLSTQNASIFDSLYGASTVFDLFDLNQTSTSISGFKFNSSNFTSAITNESINQGSSTNDNLPIGVTGLTHDYLSLSNSSLSATDNSYVEKYYYSTLLNGNLTSETSKSSDILASTYFNLSTIPTVDIFSASSFLNEINNSLTSTLINSYFSIDMNTNINQSNNSLITSLSNINNLNATNTSPDLLNTSLGTSFTNYVSFTGLSFSQLNSLNLSDIDSSSIDLVTSETFSYLNNNTSISADNILNTNASIGDFTGTLMNIDNSIHNYSFGSSTFEGYSASHFPFLTGTSSFENSSSVGYSATQTYSFNSSSNSNVSNEVINNITYNGIDSSGTLDYFLNNLTSTSNYYLSSVTNSATENQGFNNSTDSSLSYTTPQTYYYSSYLTDQFYQLQNQSTNTANNIEFTSQKNSLTSNSENTTITSSFIDYISTQVNPINNLSNSGNQTLSNNNSTSEYLKSLSTYIDASSGLSSSINNSTNIIDNPQSSQTNQQSGTYSLESLSFSSTVTPVTTNHISTQSTVLVLDSTASSINNSEKLSTSSAVPIISTTIYQSTIISTLLSTKSTLSETTTQTTPFITTSTTTYLTTLNQLLLNNYNSLVALRTIYSVSTDTAQLSLIPFIDSLILVYQMLLYGG